VNWRAADLETGTGNASQKQLATSLSEMQRADEGRHGPAALRTIFAVVQLQM
jgi:hypothetical protein